MLKEFASLETTDPQIPIIFEVEQFSGFDSMAEAFLFNALANPELSAFSQAQIGPDDSLPREWKETARRTFYENTMKVASYLTELGVERGVRVAIAVSTRPEWCEAHFGVGIAAGTVVTTYTTDSAERIAYMLVDSESKIVFAENQEILDKLLLLTENTFKVAETELRPAFETTLKLQKIITIENVEVPEKYRSLVTPWAEIMARPHPGLQAAKPMSQLTHEDIARITYTSGTTGAPKGVLCSHGGRLANFEEVTLSELLDIKGSTEKARQEVVSVFLPQAGHAFAASVLELCCSTPIKLKFAAIRDKKSCQLSPAVQLSLAKDLQEGAEGLVPAVPKMLTRLKDNMLAKFSGEGFVKSLLIKLAINNGVEKQLADHRGTFSPFTRLLHPFLQRIRDKVSLKIQEKFHPNFGCFVSGGSALAPVLEAFFRTTGFRIYQGFGMTETDCPTHSMRPGLKHRLGSIGTPYPGVEQKIDPETGELLIRSASLAKGYLGRPDSTAQSWDSDGWFHTGDAAEIDAEGFTTIIGRTNSRFTLENGENIQAETIEERFQEIPYILDVVVTGSHRPAIAALVTLKENMINEWAQANGVKLNKDLTTDPNVLKLIRDQIAEVVNNIKGPHFEKVSLFAIIPPLTVNDGLTSSQKVQRREVENKHAALLNNLYSRRGKDKSSLHSVENFMRETESIMQERAALNET